MIKRLFSPLLLIVAVNFAYSQPFVDKVKFFCDTTLISSSLTFNVKKLISHKQEIGRLFPVRFCCKISDSLATSDQVMVEVRGHFRRGYCDLPPLKLVYKQNPSCAFYHFKDLKLVSACKPTKYDDQNLLKEYLVYKIYNLLTEKSFRVRLLSMSYVDSAGKKKTVTQHAFLVEDVKELAKRNSCKSLKNEKMPARATDRNQMLLTSIFEYMIGNTDWSVPGNHNIRLVKPVNDSAARPFMIPYDFDFSGIVSADYAVPDGRLGIQTVRDRLYRGLPVDGSELAPVLDCFIQKKAAIYAAINNFNLLTDISKKEMTSYLEEFYTTISNPENTRRAFLAQ